MTNALVIVESPAKSKTITKYLGVGYTIRPTGGHIIDLSKGHGGGDIGVDIQNGFKPRYEVNPDKRDKIKSIVDVARNADEIFVASDPDREGEAIAFHIVDQLKSLNKPLKRVEFHEITEKAIRKAIANPRPFDQNLYDAQQARRVLDRIVGFMVSPYISQKLGDKLSAGRVQSVTLRMIVDREEEIEAFVPESFYNISATLSNTEKFVAKYPARIDVEKEAQRIKDDLDVSTYVIDDVQAKQMLRKAPPPLITSTLQQEASTKLKFAGERTMKAAQELYEAGFITYLRTDSVRNSADSIIEVREFLTKNGFGIPDQPNEFKNKDQAQDAHEAIRPTHVENHPDKAALIGDQQQIYNLIWRMFVASQMQPAVFDVVKVTVKASKGQRLQSEGKTLREEGWMFIAKEFLKKDKDVTLPPLAVGDMVTLVPPKVKMEKSQTKPPPRYTEASLNAELERKEIGRPSTYATIIAKISNRKYVKSTAAGFVPTDLGRQVSNDLKSTFSFMDYMYTANMEKSLDKIADGKLDYLSMMTKFFDEFKAEFQKARAGQGQVTGIPCPKCGGDTVLRKSKYGFFAGCMKYKAGCDGIANVSVEDGKVIPKSQKAKVDESVKCPDCGAGMVPRPDGRFGPFYSCSNYPKCLGKRKIPFGKKCIKCGNELYATLMSGKLKLACMGYPNCKNVEELPEDAQVNWLDYNKVTPPVYNKKVEKVIKSIS
ncbi:type I DNA topoisomerase [Candidatus Pacearchaeota archaeon]|jgi:DNA topoisomerase-1|nr:type I DNA topoisomerase [Candidatus Pacearchaeota archaeon]